MNLTFQKKNFTWIYLSLVDFLVFCGAIFQNFTSDFFDILLVQSNDDQDPEPYCQDKCIQVRILYTGQTYLQPFSGRELLAGSKQIHK